MNACDYCGGEGGLVTYQPASKWAIDPVIEGWIECETCGGSGWVDEDPPQLEMADLDERCGGADG